MNMTLYRNCRLNSFLLLRAALSEAKLRSHSRASFCEHICSHLYVSNLKPLVGVEDINTNGNTSCAPLWYSTAMKHLIDTYHKGKLLELSWSNKKHGRTSAYFLVTVFETLAQLDASKTPGPKNSYYIQIYTHLQIIYTFTRQVATLRMKYY